MQKLFFLFISLQFAVTSFAQSNNSIIGKWQSSDDKTRTLEIFSSTDGLFYGKSSNGKITLKKLKYNNDKKLFSGEFSPPEARATLNATITLINDNKFKMVASKLLFSKTVYFIKIN